jgi:hypothetical protein
MKMQACWHGCPYNSETGKGKCTWEYQHDVPEAMPSERCQYWRPCPFHAFFQASQINRNRKNYDAKKKTEVTEPDNLQAGGETWGSSDVETPRTQAFRGTGEVLASLSLSFKTWEETIEEMCVLPT